MAGHNSAMTKTLDEHYYYLNDRVKLEQYQAAISRQVRAEHVVLDLGCGSGLLGLMALRAGAAKVLFVEEGAIIEVARQTVVEAGFGDRAEFLQVNSFELALSEFVDVVVCDHVGYFGFDYGILELLADARKRFMKPDGIIIPATIDLKVALVESEDCRKLVSKWRDGSVPEEFHWLGNAAANSKHAVNLETTDLFSCSADLATFELGSELPSYLSWTTEFVCEKDGMIDGVVGWFHCRLIEDIRMTNSPESPRHLSRSQAYLPLDNAVAVGPGDRVETTLMIRHEDGVIGWNVELPDRDMRFSHSTFNGLLLDENSLERGRPDRLALLNERGRARQLVLSYCDGQRTVDEVTEKVIRDHPDLFPSRSATTWFVKSVLRWNTSG